LAATPAVTASVSGSSVIRASATFQRLGDWRIDRAPTLRGAANALGDPSSCLRIRDRTHGRAVWNSLGVAVDLVTFGGLPRGEDVCTAPALAPVNWVRVTGSRWLTARGLRVGDTIAELRRLYPHAPRNPRGTWPRPNAYWLVSKRTACVGVCGKTRFVSVPQLLAEVRRGRTIAFFFHVGAQGE
jgi:hypothetical protein